MRKIFLIIILGFMSGCSSNEVNPITVPFEPIAISFTLVGKGNINGDEGVAQQNLIVNTEEVWTNLKNQIDSEYIAIGLGNYYTENNFEETNIDFNNFTVIAVFDQVYGNGGHSIDITTIIEYENNIVVTLENLQTGNTSSVITQPYYIVKIPKATKPIIFE